MNHLIGHSLLSLSYQSSQLDSLDLVIDFEVERVEVTNEPFLYEWAYGLLIAGFTGFQLTVECGPLLIELVSLLDLLLDAELLAKLGLHLHGLFERIRVDLFEDRLQCDQRLLQNLVPMVLRQVYDDWHEHGERLVLVSLQDVEEVVILEKAHGAIGNLQVISTNALHDTFK